MRNTSGLLRGVLSLVVLSLGTAGISGQEPLSASGKGSGQRYAILIGVDDYNELEDLHYCGADQIAFRDQLIKAGFPEDQVFLLHNKATETKYIPLKANIERQLDLVLSLVERDDLLLFGFSGHGVHLDGKSYLLPAEANVENSDSMISRDLVYQRLQDCPASLKVAFIDACRDDPRPAGRRSAHTASDGIELARSLERVPEGLLLFTSCAPGEISMEEKKFGHGVFMHFILEGMQGRADADGNRNVSFKELFRYAGQKTKVYVAREFNGYQTPRKNSAEEDAEAEDFALVRLDGRSTRPAAPAVFNFADGDRTGGQAVASQQAWAAHLSVEVDRVNSLGMRLRLLPPGEFLMGSTESKADLEAKGMSTFEGFDNEDEHPQHRVQISRPFYVGVHEVTLGQFLSYYNADREKHKTDAEKDGTGGWGYDGEESLQDTRHVAWNTGWNQPVGDYMDHPVVNVSWNDANSFCAWLTKKERSLGEIRSDQEYRLLDEAQWEYAARGGSRGLFGFGNNSEALTRYGNVKDAKFSEKFSNKIGDPLVSNDGYAYTAPVGKYKSNGFGLFDTHGNVWEWCQDGYDAEAYADRGGAVKDPFVVEGLDRVLRGGSWISAAVLCRSANRSWNAPGNRGVDLGFRVSLQSVR